MRNIIITGGELFNKGAQAMTFTAVSELKKRYPDHEIFLLSPQDLQRPEEELGQYAFRFLPWEPIKFAKAQNAPLLRAACLLRNKNALLNTEKIYRSCDLMIDVSGYALGSVWSAAACRNYLDRLEYARAFHIPVYLMPQSFGPFDFSGENAAALHERIRTLLGSVRIICAREKEGHDELTQRYGLTNVQRKPDLVLNCKELDIRSVYKTAPRLRVPVIEGAAVGVVTNERIAAAAGEDAVLAMYSAVLAELSDRGSPVYILSHSSNDFALSRRIKALFPDDERIVLLEEDYSCLEFNEIVKQFRYIIASRFHAIVHAYKNCVPCISPGWAVKYRDLMAEFGQKEYFVDAREGLDAARIIALIHLMETRLETEKKKIAVRLSDLQKENVFDILPGKISGN